MSLGYLVEDSFRPSGCFGVPQLDVSRFRDEASSGAFSFSHVDASCNGHIRAVSDYRIAQLTCRAARLTDGLHGWPCPCHRTEDFGMPETTTEHTPPEPGYLPGRLGSIPVQRFRACSGRTSPNTGAHTLLVPLSYARRLFPIIRAYSGGSLFPGFGWVACSAHTSEAQPSFHRHLRAGRRRGFGTLPSAGASRVAQRIGGSEVALPSPRVPVGNPDFTWRRARGASGR